MATSGLTLEERRRAALRRVGQVVLGKWQLQQLIGAGGMAAVFEATHRNNGSQAAVKILHADLADATEVRQRFLAESYVANRVSHPGVVSVRDEGTTEDGALFLVMDLLRGQTLAQRLERSAQPLSVRDALSITSQLLDVLVHAHARGILHRDIKPENVFLTDEGRVRLLDFGLARIEGQPATHATAPGTTLGTPAFMPPEQALGDFSALDGRSDLWSLGATLYLMLSGQPVREPGSATQQLLGAMTRPVPSLGRLVAVPRSIVAVVDRALAFDRDARFPDAFAMQLAVRAALTELRKRSPSAAVPPASVEPVALSLRAPGPPRRERRSSSNTMRPVAATLPDVRRSDSGKSSRHALAAWVIAGFAVGIGIVLVARATIQPVPHAVTIGSEPALAAGAGAEPSAALPQPSALTSGAPKSDGHAHASAGRAPDLGGAAAQSGKIR
jgi:eukaryotic-like serine/threonine-protein kinase